MLVVCALLMPIDSPSSNSDSTGERGRCQRRAKHENRRDRVQPPESFIGFTSDGTISPLKPIVFIQSAVSTAAILASH